MPYFGCHLSPPGAMPLWFARPLPWEGYLPVFTRNPRGSRAKAPDLADAARAGALMKEGALAPWLPTAHIP